MWRGTPPPTGRCIGAVLVWGGASSSLHGSVLHSGAAVPQALALRRCTLPNAACKLRVAGDGIVDDPAGLVDGVSRVEVWISRIEPVAPPGGEQCGVFRVWVVAFCFASGIRLMVDQAGLWAVHNAPALFQSAQTEIDISKPYGQLLVIALDGIKGFFAHEQAGCSDGGDFVGSDQTAHVHRAL